MEGTNWFKCSNCGYEFLSKGITPTCPKCGASRLEKKDVKALAGIDE